MGCSLLKLPQAYWKKSEQGSALLSRNAVLRPMTGSVAVAAPPVVCAFAARVQAAATSNSSANEVFRLVINAPPDREVSFWVAGWLRGLFKWTFLDWQWIP